MRKTWTDQMVATELAAIVAGMGVMPSNNELRELGKNDLACQISRRGGFPSWAVRLGVPRKESESDTGWGGEIALASILESQGFSVERMKAIKAPYDLRVDGVVRIDVKAANYAEYGASRGWFYRVGKEAQADVLALYQLDTKSVYFLPWNVCPKSNVTIARDGGKYKAFRDCFYVISELAELREKEKSIWPTL